MKPHSPTPEVLTAPEAADFLRIGATTLQGLVSSGRIPHLRLSGHGLRGAIRFRVSALREWMAREEKAR